MPEELRYTNISRPSKCRRIQVCSAVPEVKTFLFLNVWKLKRNYVATYVVAGSLRNYAQECEKGQALMTMRHSFAHLHDENKGDRITLAEHNNLLRCALVKGTMRVKWRQRKQTKFEEVKYHREARIRSDSHLQRT